MSEPTGEHVPPPSFTTTYSWADGEMAAGEYGWMTSDDSFTEDMIYCTEPREMLVETWERTNVEVRTLWPSPAYCVVDVGIEEGQPAPCEAEAKHWAKEGNDWSPLCAEHKDALDAEPVSVASGGTDARESAK